MPATRCHIFCAVIDNYGDLGVCWRLARHLADDHAVAVTLWVDDLASFQHLAPALNAVSDNQRLDNLEVRRWHADGVNAPPADLVIEGFACELPEQYILAMAARPEPPVWINLEYLSAEPWVDSCHGLTSIHPGTGLAKYFWFPGFTPATGGLLRSESELTSMQTALSQRRSTRHLSLFGYEQPALASLLDTLAADTHEPTTLSVFAGRALPDVRHWLGRELRTGDHVTCGGLTIEVLPLLHHRDYDQLLAQCDLNLVRGEDSFVRAQWAGAPMLWHIYPQAEDAHLVKLKAWQARVEATATEANTPMPASWTSALSRWNAGNCDVTPHTTDWSQFLAELPDMRRAMQSWRPHLLTQPDLATQLMRFYANRVESRPK